jgi:hypothetical protein
MRTATCGTFCSEHFGQHTAAADIASCAACHIFQFGIAS